MKKTVLVIFSILMSITFLFNLTSLSAVYTFETQFEHASAERSWLTDLVVKEDMLTVDGLAGRVTLIPNPDTPYRDTPDSFKEDVAKYCSLYSLNESTPKAGYIYLFDMLGQSRDTYFFGASDRDIKEYLQSNGIVYPTNIDNDEQMMARALYTAMITGTFTSADFVMSNGNIALEKALISYITSLSGMDVKSLEKWLPSGSSLSLDDYLLAASKLTLWTSGYDVSPTTDSNEVYRLVAVMTIEKIGISVNRDVTFAELKAKYTAALLGKKYGVSISDKKLSDAFAQDNVPFYILQLIGQKEADLSIRADIMTYEDAFYAVARNTKYFDLEDGEFYADIYNYEAHLSEKRSSIWLYPTAYETGNSGANIKVTANGKQIKNNYFTEIGLNPSLSSEKIVIQSECTVDGKKYSSTYTITLYQGTKSDSTENDVPSSEPNTFASSDSIVSDIFSTLGLNTAVSDLMDDFYTYLPPDLRNTMSFIAPTFDEEDASPSDKTDSTQSQPDGYFASVLDKIGKVVDSDIVGISGASFNDMYSANVFSFDYITFS